MTIFVVLLPYLSLIALLLFASAFFSGSETALFSLDRYSLEKLEEDEGRAGAIVRNLLDQPRKLLATLLVGNELVNVTISAVGLAAVFRLGDLLEWEHVPWWMNILVVTPVLLLFGEIAPKAVAVRAGPLWAKKVALPLRAFGSLITPVRFLLDLIVRGLLKGMRIQSEDPLPNALKEAQFRALVNLGEQQGVIGADEAELIHRVFELTDTAVSRIMTSRADVVMAAQNSTLPELLDLVKHSGYSRLPVFTGEPDNLSGILLSKDLIAYHYGGKEFDSPEFDSLLKPAYFVPPGKPCGELLQEFQKERGHMAIVLDEHGAMVGLITMQDLLDELFEPVEGATGQHQIPGIERIGAGLFRVPARTEIAEWNRTMKPVLPAGDAYNTVAGYIFHLFGRLPRKGESITDDGWVFHVTGLEGTRLTWVTAHRRDGGRK